MIAAIGTSSLGIPSQIGCHMPRETLACSLLTPLTYAAPRIAATVMQNESPPDLQPRRPASRNSSQLTPSFSGSWPMYFSINSSLNMSLPAGTGVCVVKQVVAWTSSTACANDRPWAARRSAIR